MVSSSIQSPLWLKHRRCVLDLNFPVKGLSSDTEKFAPFELVLADSKLSLMLRIKHSSIQIPTFHRFLRNGHKCLHVMVDAGYNAGLD